MKPEEQKLFLPAIALGAVLLLSVVLVRFGYWPGSRVVISPAVSVAALLPGVLLAHTNQDRVLNGLTLLAENPLLNQAAELKARDMLDRQYYAHVGPDGATALDWLDKVGYKYLNVGENLDLTYGGDETEIENAWMNSPEHKANILLPLFTEVGVAIESGTYQGQQVTFAVEEFATPYPAHGTQAKPASAPASAPTSAAHPTSTPQKADASASEPVSSKPSLRVPKPSSASPSPLRVILTPVEMIVAAPATPPQEASTNETIATIPAEGSSASSTAHIEESATASQFIGLTPGSGLHSNIRTSSWGAFFSSLRTSTSQFLIYRFSQGDSLSF